MERKKNQFNGYVWETLKYHYIFPSLHTAAIPSQTHLIDWNNSTWLQWLHNLSQPPHELLRRQTLPHTAKTILWNMVWFNWSIINALNFNYFCCDSEMKIFFCQNNTFNKKWTRFALIPTLYQLQEWVPLIEQAEPGEKSNTQTYSFSACQNRDAVVENGIHSFYVACKNKAETCFLNAKGYGRFFLLSRDVTWKKYFMVNRKGMLSDTLTWKYFC